MRSFLIGACAVAFAASAMAATTAAPPQPSAADKAAIFKAAGFKAKGDKYVRCEDDAPSAMTGFIELNDLNGDGTDEAFVRESSTNCYGATAEAFVLVGKDAKGNWSVLLDEVGMALPLETKHKGWLDIEVGGPGMGPFPHFQYNGKKYVTR